MSALSTSLVLSPNPRLHLSSGSFLKPVDQSTGTSNLSYGPNRMGNLQLSTSRKPLVVQARDGGRSDTTGIFVSGFILGGAVVGALGVIFAPQLSKALVGENRKELLKKIPFYDEEKLTENRQVLVDKIDQLNSAIDKVATRLRQTKEEADDEKIVNMPNSPYIY